jgi:predicted transcriptional regulator
MTTAKLKSKVIDKIKTIEDAELLESVYNMIESDLNLQVSMKLSKEQIAAIEEGRKDIREGRTFTDEEVKKEIDKWLNE